MDEQSQNAHDQLTDQDQFRMSHHVYSPPPGKGRRTRSMQLLPLGRDYPPTVTGSAYTHYSILCRNWQDVGRPCGRAGTALAVTERAGGRGTRKGYAASVRLLRRQRLRKGPPLRRVTVDGAQHQPPLLKADSPCQGEMSRRDKRDRARWHGEAVTEGFCPSSPAGRKPRPF